MIDPTIMIFTSGVLCTALGAAAMYFPAYAYGYKVADAKGDKFWAMQQKIKSQNAKEKREKKLRECKKGWQTRRERSRDMSTTITRAYEG